jgi:hypothetical protein
MRNGNGNKYLLILILNSDSSTEKSDSDDEVFTINSVDDELKGIFKELRTLSFDDKFAKSDDEIIDSNEHDRY